MKEKSIGKKMSQTGRSEALGSSVAREQAPTDWSAIQKATAVLMRAHAMQNVPLLNSHCQLSSLPSEEYMTHNCWRKGTDTRDSVGKLHPHRLG